MSRDEVREIVRECLEQAPLMREMDVQALVARTVRATLTGLGVEHAAPLEVQQDLAWLRRTRLAAASVSGKVGAAVVAILVSALAAASWLGFQALMRRDP